jgi:NAD(P)-dependent dehydrogenase (short-subunit alcohol dehydrogenase family)
MREAGGGAMVVVASTLATHTATGTAAYAASKAALVAAARTFARELAPTVRVNVVAPGVVDTDMVRAPRRPLAPGEVREDVVRAELATLRALHPLARLGTPDDVAAAVQYLLEAAWVTGSVLTVDGGLTL